MHVDRPVSEILNEPGRLWTPKPPAGADEIEQLRESAPFDLPAKYVELLRYCNGGEGELDAPPLYFQLDSIADSMKHNLIWHEKGEYTGFWFIGGNGGMESIGFDLREGPPWSLVMIDLIAGTESAERIAGDIAEFIEKIGLEADRPRT